MFLLRKPIEPVVREFISSQRDLPFTYRQVGATRTAAPAGYTVDHNRIKLGEGKDIYRRAAVALRSWQQFDLGWATVVPSQTELKVGAVVAVQAKTFGWWSLNACRVVYMIDQMRPDSEKFGFAYGTLPGHAECGEERFTIEWQEDDSVWYDIYAFSRPQHPLVKLGFSFARRLQKRFIRESLAAMVMASGRAR